MISLHPLGGIRKSLVQFQLQLLTRPRIGVNHSRAKRPPILEGSLNKFDTRTGDFDEFDAPENIVHFLERISLSISGSFIQSP
uniref:Uncharacterized protein n=1 Tax=Globodera rostochiensis TaxID=31243 RepID=A0A914IG91_GLORO